MASLCQAGFLLNTQDDIFKVWLCVVMQSHTLSGRPWKKWTKLNLLNRVFISICRNFGRTLILFMIIFILGCVASGAVSVMQAVRKVDDDIRANLPAIVSIELDQESLNMHYHSVGQFADFDSVTLNVLAKIATLPYVESYEISILGNLFSKNLSQVVLDDNFFTGFEPWTHHSVKGVQGSTIFDIENGLIEIVSGRQISADEVRNRSYVALISKEFASLNNLGVGSMLYLDNIAWSNESLWSETRTEDHIFSRQEYTFEVVGVFESRANPNTGAEHVDMHIIQHIESRIYAPAEIVDSINLFVFEQFQEENSESEWAQKRFEDIFPIENIYHIGDMRDLDNFKEAVEYILPNFWTVTTLGNSFEQIDASLQTINELVTLILVIAIAASILILSLLLILSLRERKQEIGICLALGESKAKVVFQMILEVLTISLFAIALSLAVGNVIASNVSENMLREDLARAAAQRANDGVFVSSFDYMGFSPGESVEEMLERYDVSLDAATAVTFFAVFVVTILASSILPLLYIVRLDPKKILM